MNALSPNTVNYEVMGASLLSQQPPQPRKDKLKSSASWSRIYAHLEGRFSGLRTWRYGWWLHWAELARFILPRRYHFLVVANRTFKGSPINNAIIDSTGTLAMQTCAAGLWTGLTSPSRPWFKLGIALPWVPIDEDMKAWLKDTQERIYTVLAQSNFYNIMAQAFQDVSTFATSPVIIYEDVEDVIRCYLPCAGEYYLATGARLSVDVLYREFVLTVAQIVEMFGLDNCPPEVAKLWQSGGAEWSSEFVVAHAVEPNNPLEAYGKSKTATQVVPAVFTFREVYWLRGKGDNAELSRRGFNEKPFMVARWATVSNDAYGRGPSMDALNDIKQLQVETIRKAEFIEKLVRPPMVADVAMKNEPSSIIPGHVTYTDTSGTKKGFFPAFEVNPASLMPMVEDIKEIQTRIKDCWFVNLFMAISQMEGVQPRNELEITKRDLERLQGLGPFINMFETEFAGPAIQRVLSIMQRKKMLKPMPASMRGVPLKFDYISILKLAQRSAETVALKDVLTVGGQMSEAAQAAGLPNPLRIINLDQAMRDYVGLSNVDPVILYTDDQVSQHDEARAAANKQAQLQAAAPTAVDAAKSLAATPMGGNTALSAILSGGQPATP